MTIYEGRRTIDGLVVTADGKRLDEHYEIKRFTRFGFEWTYEGDSPQQLALAILFDRLGNKERAIQLSEPFMKTVIANLDNDWKLTSEEIEACSNPRPRPAHWLHRVRWSRLRSRKTGRCASEFWRRAPVSRRPRGRMAFARPNGRLSGSTPPAASPAAKSSSSSRRKARPRIRSNASASSCNKRRWTAYRASSRPAPGWRSGRWWRKPAR